MGNVPKSVFVSFNTIGAALSPQSLTKWGKRERVAATGIKTCAAAPAATATAEGSTGGARGAVGVMASTAVASWALAAVARGRRCGGGGTDDNSVTPLLGAGAGMQQGQQGLWQRQCAQ